MDIKRALMKRAQLLGEGLSGGCGGTRCGDKGMGLTGGVRKQKRRARGITGGTIPPQLRAWHSHVKKVRAMLPANTPYKMVLMAAKKTYK